MNLIKTLLEAFPQEDQSHVVVSNGDLSIKSKAERLIKDFADQNKTHIDDVMSRLKGYTKGSTRKPRTDVDARINIIPLLDSLAQIGAVNKLPSGGYKSRNPLSMLFRDSGNTVKNHAATTGQEKRGNLQVAQAIGMGAYANPDGKSAGNLVDSLPKGSKRGQDKSGIATAFIKDAIKTKDPEYNALSDSTKKMLDTMGGIYKPQYAFSALQYLLKHQASKKGYVPFVQHIKDLHKDPQYVEGLYSLEQAGIINTGKNTINSTAVSDIRKAMEYMKLEPVDDIKYSQKTRAFLPMFGSVATKNSGNTHNTISAILNNPKKFGNVGGYINSTLTDAELYDILNKDEQDLRNNITHRAIHKLATGLNANTVDELKDAIATKKGNLDDYKGDKNKAAIEDGRLAQFIKTFSI